MSRKKSKTRVMKIKDPKVEKDSRYAFKSWNAKKKGIFTANSPFNPINHHGEKRDVGVKNRTHEIMIGFQEPNIIDRMIEKKRGISDDQLMQSKFKVDESREEAL